MKSPTRKRLILALAVLPCVTLAIDPRLVPDPLYQPRIGDLVVVGLFDTKSKSCYDVDASKDADTYREYCEALKTNNESVIDKLLDSESLITIEAGTRAELLRMEEYPIEDPRDDAAYIRPDHGPYKNRFFWVSRSEVLRKVGVAKPEGGTPKSSAATLLKSAQNLEKAGKATGALEYYQRVVKEFPDAPEAKMAGERIKALKKASK